VVHHSSGSPNYNVGAILNFGDFGFLACAAEEGRYVKTVVFAEFFSHILYLGNQLASRCNNQGPDAAIVLEF